MTTVAEATIDSAPPAAGTWATTTNPIEGYFNVSISTGGTFTSATTVHVQRSLNSTDWFDVDSFTALTEDYGFEPELMYYRIGVKNGNLNGGEEVTVRIGREDKDRH